MLFLVLAVALAGLGAWGWSVYKVFTSDEADFVVGSKTAWSVGVVVGGVFGAIVWIMADYSRRETLAALEAVNADERSTTQDGESGNDAGSTDGASEVDAPDSLGEPGGTAPAGRDNTEPATSQSNAGPDSLAEALGDDDFDAAELLVDSNDSDTSS